MKFLLLVHPLLPIILNPSDHLKQIVFHSMCLFDVQPRGVDVAMKTQVVSDQARMTAFLQEVSEPAENSTLSFCISLLAVCSN